MRITFEKILFLKTIPLFEEIPESVLSDIVEASHEVSAIMGSDIIKIGETLESLYIIIQGSVRVTRNGKIVKELGKGELFGEVSVFDPIITDFSITAAEDALMFRIDREDLSFLIDEHPVITKAFLPALCRRLRKATTKLVL